MRRHCLMIRALLLLCIVVELVFFVLAWSQLLPAGAGVAVEMTPQGLSVEAMRAMPAPQRWAGMLAALPELLALAYALWRLDRLLAGFQRRVLFSAAAIGHLRAFAGAMLLSTACGIVEPALRALLFRHAFHDAQARLGMGVDSQQVLLILVCGLFYLITGVLREGRRLAEENEAFI